MSEPVTVKLTREQEVEREAQKARERALKRVKERDAVSEGFKTHTKGEKFFNDLTYTGFGYFGVTGLSIYMTWLIQDAKAFWGMKQPLSHYFDKAKTALSKIKFIGGNAGSLLTIGTLFTGGSLMTITGVKWLEDNKAAFVKWCDKHIFYGKDIAENNPEIVEAHKIMEAQPKQTWASVGGSRIVAFVATITSWLLIGKNQGWIAEKLGTSIDTMGVQFGRWGGRLLNKGKVGEGLIEEAIQINRKDHPNMRSLVDGKDTPWTRIFSYAGMDGLYTIITSVGLFISTRFLAPIFDKVGLEKFNAQTEQKSHKKETVPIPSENLDRAEDTTVPRVKVENVEHADRLAQRSAEKYVGAPA